MTILPSQDPPDRTARGFSDSEEKPHSDGSLLQFYRQGNNAAAEQLFARYAAKLERLAKYNLSRAAGQRIDAEDIVQSVFRRFFASVDRGNYDLPRGADLWSLLMVIALNRVRSEEALQRAGMRDIRCTVPFEDQHPAGPGLSAEQGDLTRLLIAEAIEDLPAQHRAVVELRIQNYEVAEIAARVQRSKRTVERLLQEARAALLKNLGDDAPEPLL
ncbi:MAG: sigma-70 family RNA polymerase sigma factor [Pirellulales bacterium]|nr:sigma-70 family RNA polymerase sigma factor [Pirellulales bacterium]